jgi:Xaa-Pro aminopeptidase
MGGRQKAGFIGHGIGLVLNELPVLAPKSKMILQAGMTIAVEPKFVIDGVGAVGNENTYIVHKESAMESVSLAPEEIVKLKV